MKFIGSWIASSQLGQRDRQHPRSLRLQQFFCGGVAVVAALGHGTVATANPEVAVTSASATTDASFRLLPTEQHSDRIAQFFPAVNDNRRLVSVVGNGQASAPADYADLQMVFGAGDAYFQSETPTPLAPLREADLQPIADAIEALGIPPENIQIYLGVSPGMTPDLAISPRLQVRLDSPTHRSIRQVIDAVQTVDRASDRLALQQFGTSYSLNDCRPLEGAARLSAMADAETKSQSIATAAGLEIGELVALSGGDAYPTLYGGYACPSSPTAYIDPYSVPPPYTPFIPVEVRLTATVTTVYEMQD